MRLILQVTCKHDKPVIYGAGKVREKLIVPADTKVVAAFAKPGHPAASAGTPRVPVETLLAGGREAILLHGVTEYRLRLTSNGKLILTK